MVATNPALALCDEVDQDRVLADLRTFFGPRAERFLTIYEKMRARPPAKRTNVVAWNWVVFLTGFVWFFYRKQYLIGALVLVLPIAIAQFIPHAGAGFTGTAVILAMWANGWYVHAGLSRIAKADKSGLTGDERTAFLQRGGGVSTVAGVLGGSLFAAMIGLLALGIVLAD